MAINGDMASIGGIMALLAGILVFAIIISAVLYVYMALVWSTIAKKLNYNKPWLAWIPIVNFFLIPILAKKHWAWGFILLIPIVNLIFITIWLWNIFEQRKYPGWLSLGYIGSMIPAVGPFLGLANLIIIGFVAWSNR